MEGCDVTDTAVRIRSRFRRAPGPRHPWVAGDVTVDLPATVDWVAVNVATGEEMTRIEARVDLVDGRPEIVQMSFGAPDGLDLVRLQREFRWASPLEVVTGLVPQLVENGCDPYAVELPLTGFPQVAAAAVRRGRSLTDEFLRTVAREYLVLGRGYTTTLADKYVVSPRTVISWVEKARARGLLSEPPTQGAAGGRLER